MKNTQNTMEKQEHRQQTGVERTSPRRVFQPSTDIYETKDTIVVLADLPGVDERDVEVNLEKNVLTIRGKVGFDRPKEGYQPLYREYEFGDFERSFTLSNDIDREAISAALEAGVLRLTLPKAKELQPRKIAVKAS